MWSGKRKEYYTSDISTTHNFPVSQFLGRLSLCFTDCISSGAANVVLWHKHSFCRVAFQLRKMGLVDV